MTFILVIATAVVILTFELARRSRRASSGSVASPVRQVRESVEVVERFFHPAHTWALVNSGVAEVTVGSDEFSTRLVGTLNEVELPVVGQVVHQGERLAVLRHGNRTLTQSSPVSGIVVETNDGLRRRPELLNESPLEKGWLARILPSNLTADLRNLLSGSAADAWWEAIRSQVIGFFSPSIGPVLQDGGKLIRNIGDQLSDEEWVRLVRHFFPFEIPQPPQNKPTNEGVSS